jgi:hypothetical protein
MDDEMGGVRRGKPSCHHPFDEPRKRIWLVLVTVDHFLPLFKGFCSARRLQDNSSTQQASGKLCVSGDKNGQTEYARPHVFQALSVIRATKDGLLL